MILIDLQRKVIKTIVKTNKKPSQPPLKINFYIFIVIELKLGQTRVFIIIFNEHVEHSCFLSSGGKIFKRRVVTANHPGLLVLPGVTQV